MVQTKTTNVLIKKLSQTFFLILLSRIGTAIPVPHVSQQYLNDVLNSNILFQIINAGKNTRLGIFSLGIIPYINASIIIQLLTSVIPQFETLQKEEGEKGRRTLKRYTRLLTLVLSIQQSFSILNNVKATIFNWNIAIGFDIMLALVTGAMLMVWFSEQITENGIGNGTSILIAINILSSTNFTQQNWLNLFNSNLPNIIGGLTLIFGIIYVQEAKRSIPLISAKQLFAQEQKLKTNNAYLPLRINQGGVMPIIFSSAIINFILQSSRFFELKIPIMAKLLNFIFYTPLFLILKFVLIFGFTFFYSTFIVVNCKELANELNKMTVTIPNVRPGKPTEQFLNTTLTRLSMLGGIFLASLIIIPNIISNTNIGVTSFLILIGVIIEMERQIVTLVIANNYNNIN